MASIAIIGSGIVGGATGKGLAEKGNAVTFFDIDPKKIEVLRKSGYSAFLMEQFDPKAFDAFFVVVPTPTEAGKFCNDHLQKAIENLGVKLKNKKEYFVVVVRSTVLPGTTEGLVIPILEKHAGKVAGIDFGVAMNPEYLREKTAVADFKNPHIVTIGALDQRSDEFMSDVYKKFKCPIHHTTIVEAEIQKYVHNIFNATKIAFFNEMRVICERMGIDDDIVFAITAQSAEASWNSSYGIKDIGHFGGMCLPKDTQAFSEWAKKSGFKTRILDAVISANEVFRSQREFVQYRKKIRNGS